MKLQTPLPPYPVNHKISLGDKILTMGSCFSDSIGNKLVDNKFDTLVNPFGTIFDPLSIARLLTYSLNKSTPALDTYVQSQGVYKNIELHSSFTGLSRDELALKVNARIALTNNFISSADWLIITFGTAHIYQYLKTESYIANCQKLPAGEFSKHLVLGNKLLSDMQKAVRLLRQTNPDLKIIVTVSPVRHISDGLVENSLSKAILRQLCHDLSIDNEQVGYYPSFEIMMDDLRDYRFYKEDMIHPSDQAIDYIWHHFSATYLTKESVAVLKTWQGVKRSLNHRPFNPTTKEHQEFLKQTLSKLNSLKDKIDIMPEIESINKQIIKE